MKRPGKLMRFFIHSWVARRICIHSIYGSSNFRTGKTDGEFSNAVPISPVYKKPTRTILATFAPDSIYLKR